MKDFCKTPFTCKFDEPLHGQNMEKFLVRVQQVVTHDSRRSFQFSRLNSLFSWAFSRQDKKIKIIGIVKFESYLNTLNTEVRWLCSFF